MSLKFQLTYNKGLRCGDDSYSIGIPDNFILEKGAEDRDFIAYLPSDDADGYSGSDIVFFAGKALQENDNDTRLLVPELCSTLIENTFWGNPISRMMCKSSKYIPLDKKQPAGGINAGYDEDSFFYNISVFLPGCIKTMRVQVYGAQEKDIAICDKMVVDWMNTMTSTKPFDTTRRLDDPFFIDSNLSSDTAAEWKTASDIHFTIIQLLIQNRIQTRTTRYRAEVSNGDSEIALRNDIRDYVSAAAKAMESFLEMGVRGLEQIKEKNPNSPMLKKYYDVLRPAVMSNDEISISIDGGKTNISSSVSNILEIRERFANLDPTPELLDMIEKQKNDALIKAKADREKAIAAAEERARREREESEKKNREAAAKAHMEKIISECNTKVDEFKKELSIALDEHMSDLQKRIPSKEEELKKQKVDKEAYLSTLGFFNISEKKEAKDAILRLDSEIRRLNDPKLIEEEKAIIKDAYDKALKQYSSVVKKHLKSRFPGYIGPNEFSFPSDNNGLKLWILYALTKSKSMSVEEIIDKIDSKKSKPISHMKITSLLADLIDEGEVNRVYMQRKAYYSLVDSAKNILHRLSSKVEIFDYSEIEEYAKEGNPVPPKVKDIELPATDLSLILGS